MKITTIAIIAFSSFVLGACNTDQKTKESVHSAIKVEYPETYELANIILALTEYGKTDEWEVRKGFDYYNEMLEYFTPVDNHPLLDSVNFSRERWDEYLSFRTDSYAFSFDENNKLKRQFNFHAIDSIAAFDKNLELINDFVEKSKFRDFFAAHKDYYTKIKARYQEKLYLNEMRDFLIAEFGNHVLNVDYRIILSHFVYRMNCHLNIGENISADFITLPDFVISGTNALTSKELAIGVHYIFTEMDHGFINPTTESYKDLVSESFDESIWSEGSGYEDKNNAVFNEYMTWAVYDIFIQKYFPEEAKEVGLYWSYQNDTRGFIYAEKFTQKLIEIYNQNNGKKNISDLYPELLQWTKNVQINLTKPKIILPEEPLVTSFESKIPIKVAFSEEMQKKSHFTIILQDAKNLKTTLAITSGENHIEWAEDGKTLKFNMNIPASNEYAHVIFNWWESPEALYSTQGVLLKSSSYFTLMNENE